jgi:hypothetical protein
MNREEKEKLIQQFLDGELDASQEERALRLMADEQEYRDILHFELFLNRAFQNREVEAQSFDVPDGFEEQVMTAVEQKQREEASAEKQQAKQRGWIERIKKGLDSLLEPRTVQWRPAYGLAAVVAVMVIVIALNLGLQNPMVPTNNTQSAAKSDLKQQVDDRQAVKVASMTTDKDSQVWARFFYVNDKANTVAVAGDFSNWEPIPLDPKKVNGNKVWSGTIQMQKGEHRYMYIINGEKWKTDPLAKRYMNDGFGHRNAVISL